MQVQQKNVDKESINYLISHNKSSCELVSDIIANTRKVEGCSDLKSVLPYCEITIKTPNKLNGESAKTSYILTKGQNNSGPDEPVTFYNFEQLVAYILQKWW